MFGRKKQNEPIPRRRRLAEDDVEQSGSLSPGQFRRNQTLSSYRHNTPEESSRQKAHHLTVQRRKLGGIFTLVFAAVVLLTLLLWQLVAQVQIITSTKQLSEAFRAASYEEVVQEYLSLNPAQRLRVALNTDDLSRFVTAQLPEVEKLELTGAPGMAQGSFSITFRTPVAGWVINGQQYYVDAEGVVFQKNYYPSPEVQIVDESGITPEQGTAVAGSRLLGFLGRVVSQAESRGYTVIRAVLPVNTTRQLDVFMEGSETRLKFSIDRGAGEQVEDADRVLRQLSRQGSRTEYVDVRIPGRAAYR